VNLSGGSGAGTPTGWPLTFWTNRAACGNATIGQPFGNNTYTLYGFSLEAAVLVNKIVVWIAVIDAAGLYDLGIYNAAGTLVAHTGPIHLPSANMQAFSVAGAPITLPAGKYYFATTGSAVTAQYQVFTGGSGAVSFANATGLGAATGGTLPATIAPPADAFAAAGNPTLALTS
jgi:hypothetical protein